MTRQEFFEKYKDVKFEFSYYEKFIFHYEGEYEGSKVSIQVGGNSDDAYNVDCSAKGFEYILALDPFFGLCGQDKFYDY